MKIPVSIFWLLFFVLASSAQTGKVLATIGDKSFPADLPQIVGNYDAYNYDKLKQISANYRQISDDYDKLPQIIGDLRHELLEQQIVAKLLGIEAKVQKTTLENLLAAEVTAKVTAPGEKQIQEVYDASKDKIGDKTLAEVRPQIIKFLRQDEQQRIFGEYINRLGKLHNAKSLKDVNAPLLQPTDAVASVAGEQITAEEFEEKAAPKLYEARMSIYSQIVDALNSQIFPILIDMEAKQSGVSAEQIIAREVTSKMQGNSNDERVELYDGLIKRLNQKYDVKILVKEPAPFRQNIAVLPANPSRGSAAASVTVIMFTDFQCPACSAAHPVLQKVLAEYGNKIRFVVRHFPLTQIHANAYNAALAAAAAQTQGKFFEYIDILYKNQDKLDIASLKKYASDLGLNSRQFDADLDGKKFDANVKKDIADGNAYGIGGTPTVYVNGVKVYELSSTGFRRAIESALKK